MKLFFAAVVFLVASVSACTNGFDAGTEVKEPTAEQKSYRELTGIIKKGETFFDIFKTYQLDLNELFKIREAAADTHRLRELYPGRAYKIILDNNDRIDSLEYSIDDDETLNIVRTESGFHAEKRIVEYEKRIQHIGGVISDNLISSIGEGRENLMLAMRLSDIFAWDIDFTTDVRNDDIFKIVVEGFYLNGEFKKFGDILSAEFVNGGNVYQAYRFKHDGTVDYYDAGGKSLRKIFLKAPLNFKRISSGFSRGRFHPVLKIYRPHHGLDYAAPAGTPVSSVGDGNVLFAGRKGQYGNLVIVKHRNGWKTYYGHLSRISKGIKSGKRVQQGAVIGSVGSTGLATGPHLHYEVRIHDKAVNPLSLKLPKGESIPGALMTDFKQFTNQMGTRLASINLPAFARPQKVNSDKI